METKLETLTIEEAVKSRATDIHIDPLMSGYCIRFRIDGILKQWEKVEFETGIRLINQIKTNVGIDPGTVFHPIGERQKMLVDGKMVDLRVTLAPCISGPKIAIRILDPDRIGKSVSNLGLQEANRLDLETWAAELNGMLLVTGPTACGKTTTLYALLHELVEESRHVVTIEDPVEYEIDGINQMQVDLRHHLDFTEGVKTSLRLDPDCFMVGEIRDSEPAKQALNAAIQGHVVMATLHSRDAVSSITRLRNFGMADHQLAAAIGVIVNQRLVRKLCPHCLLERSPSATEVSFFETHRLDVPGHVSDAAGCDQCDGSGYHGRTGIFEIWNLDSTDYEMILAGADEESIRKRLVQSYHAGLLNDAWKKITTGVTSVGEIGKLGLELPWEND